MTPGFLTGARRTPLGYVSVVVRAKLVEKVGDLDTLRAGAAAKQYGMLNFLELGMFGRVGAGGLTVIKDGQTDKGVTLTPALMESLDMVMSVLQVRTKGQYDISMILDGDHIGGSRPRVTRPRRGWFKGNTAALVALIRGRDRSASVDLERLSQFIHLCPFALSISLFWEWVPSKSSWADAISCMGYSDPWYVANGRSSSPSLFPIHFGRSLPARSVHVDDCGFTPLDKQDYEMVRQVTFAKKKQKAMEQLLRKFYKKGSWKNVISLGDGPAERQALQEIGFRHMNPASPKTGEQKSFRTKSVKMLEEPACSELIAELQMVQAWLPALASLDDDVDIDLAEGEEALLDMHQQLMDVVESGSRSTSPDSSAS
ncbi:hypothetical protein AK812_SmicGene10510 [Symbiodinium microadriaticum]|uniref:Uncharacterized protein n=1 Tax=Symbiodinium microadriaticum TaxID=2951 RepID=A0A1Q9EFH7_SYMMI|nr:hypothetical protein AK812_SmicGene10510 [Symbiodinium microadriaticum]